MLMRRFTSTDECLFRNEAAKTMSNEDERTSILEGKKQTKH